MSQILYRGNEHVFSFTAELDGVPQDVTGCLFTMTARYSLATSDAAAFTVADAGFERVDVATGKMKVTIPPSATASLTGYPARLYADIEMKDALGKPHTLWNQSFYVLSVPTRPA